MIYLAVGDIHIDENGRLDDLKKVLDQIVDIAESKEVDKVLFLGDAFTSRRPTPVEYDVMNRWVSTLVRADIQVVLLRGNHDKQRDVSALDVFQTLRVHPDDPLSKYVTVVDDNYIENGILLGHYIIKEAVMGPTNYHLESAVTVAQMLARYPEVRLFLMGDIHKPQQVWKSPAIYYAGSIDRNNFGERLNNPRVLLVNEDDYSVESIPLSVRSMVQLEIEAVEIEKVLNVNSAYASGDRTFEPEVKNAIVKLIVSGTEDELSKVDMAEIREAFKHAYSLSVHQEIAKTGVIRDAAIQDSMSDSDVLCKYVNEKRTDLAEDDKKKVLKLGNEIVTLKGLARK